MTIGEVVSRVLGFEAELAGGMLFDPTIGLYCNVPFLRNPSPGLLIGFISKGLPPVSWPFSFFELTLTAV